MSSRSGQRARHAEALVLLRAFVADLSTSARAVESKTGVTNAQLFLLQELAASGPRSLGELADVARTQLSTVSIVIGRLQRAGLVTRVPAVDDRRRVVVALTSAGKQLVRRAPVAPTARLVHAMDSLSEGDARALIKGLKPLLAHLGTPHGEAPLMFEAASASPARRQKLK